MSILVLTSDTLIGTPATGNLEYNGQFFGTDSNASRAQMQRITLGTAVASTSGTSIDFTGIPAWVKKITVMLSGVSTNGTSTLILQLGDSGGIETSGYAGGCLQNGTQTAWASSAMLLNRTGAAVQVNTTQAVLTLLGSNQWVLSSTMYGNESGGIYMGVSSGAKTLSDTLDRIRITTTNGTDTFDAGSINILYEG